MIRCSCESSSFSCCVFCFKAFAGIIFCLLSLTLCSSSSLYSFRTLCLFSTAKSITLICCSSGRSYSHCRVLFFFISTRLERAIWCKLGSAQWRIQDFEKGGSSITSGGSIKKAREGGAEKSGYEAAPPPAQSTEIFVTKLFKRPGIALMGSLQISTRSAFGKVVHAVGLWPLTSLTHRKSACSRM